MNTIRMILRGMLRTIRMPSVHATDVLEILILAFVVYKLLDWIKQTRAWTLLKGFLTIFVFVVIVYLLQMDTLIYIVNHSISIVLIAAAVIFQPELRKALETLGEKRIISNLLPIENVGGTVKQLFTDKTISELVRACTEMGKVKTGALIVIRQNETLEEYERTGIAVDALVTSQLLINIFEKNTPLHDGAVIVQGDRVQAATCYLPLSDNMALSKELGTRHRAAVGISEATDSFTIVVSEETGHISIAYKGVLSRNITADTLRQRLTVLQNKSVTSRKIRFKIGKGKA